eukprot:gene230-366_t
MPPFHRLTTWSFTGKPGPACGTWITPWRRLARAPKEADGGTPCLSDGSFSDQRLAAASPRPSSGAVLQAAPTTANTSLAVIEPAMVPPCVLIECSLGRRQALSRLPTTSAAAQATTGVGFRSDNKDFVLDAHGLRMDDLKPWLQTLRSDNLNSRKVCRSWYPSTFPKQMKGLRHTGDGTALAVERNDQGLKVIPLKRFVPYGHYEVILQ